MFRCHYNCLLGILAVRMYEWQKGSRDPTQVSRARVFSSACVADCLAHELVIPMAVGMLAVWNIDVSMPTGCDHGECRLACCL